jgi:hypothetical protein
LRIDELAAEAFAELLDELEYAKQKTLKSVPSRWKEWPRSDGDGSSQTRRMVK